MPASDAPPVLLLHGFAASADRTWRDNGWVDLLGDLGRDVLAVDLLGHGDADKPHDPAASADLEARDPGQPLAGLQRPMVTDGERRGAGERDGRADEQR